MADAATIQGECDPRFAPLRAAFAENFERDGEVGAAVAVMVDGRMVVDLWGGLADGADAVSYEGEVALELRADAGGEVSGAVGDLLAFCGFGQELIDLLA